MKVFLSIFFLACSASGYSQQNDMELWYKNPAQTWLEALPVGNGRLGAMVFGDYKQENLQLNEESVWAGSRINNNNPEAKLHLKEIQEAIFNKEYKKAFELSNKYMIGTPPRIRSYQPLGNLFIHYQWKGQPETYRRSLDLHTGIAQTTYRIDGNTVTQEVFSSAPNDVIIVSITAEKGFDADLFLSREFNHAVENAGRRRKMIPSKPIYENQYRNKDGLAYFTGQIIDTISQYHGPAGKHMRYAAGMKIISINGKALPVSTDSSSGFQLKSVKRIVIALTGATDYNLEKLDVDAAIDPLATCRRLIGKAATQSPSALNQIHISDHRSVFDRVHFSLGVDGNSQYPTDERLARMKEGKSDNSLLALYYQYGRYLLMGSSRKPGRLPANLQGIWNDLYDAPWNADFHTNINLQMNYWHAESGNLPETSEVLAGFMQHLTRPGAVTAKEMYGASGWTMHHLTDPFGITGVMDGVWGITPMDGPWMTFPLYDHFEFTNDTAYLKRIAYPLMKGSVAFVLDILVKSPEGYLVTNPSHSPENEFFVPGTDKKETSQLTYAPTIDIHIVNALFNNFLAASKILGVDNELAQKVIAARNQLPPLKVAANGTLQEWIEDFEEVDPGHRHISHLLGLYPLNLISQKEPAFFEAARKSLERRLSSGRGHTGWSKAWIISLYARLLDADKALDNLNGLIRKSTLNNLFDSYPPFQIDGNFGGAAGIAEMLLQSQNGEIHLLPALPAAWQDGFIHGLRARGAVTVDQNWKAGRLTSVKIKADKGGSYTLRYGDIVKQIKLGGGQSLTLDGSLNRP